MNQVQYEVLKKQYLSFAREQFIACGMQVRKGVEFKIGIHHEGESVKLTYSVLELFGEMEVEKAEKEGREKESYENPLFKEGIAFMEEPPEESESLEDLI